MICRVIVADPRNPEELLVYQVPENSRAHALLTESFEKLGYEYTTLASQRRSKSNAKIKQS